MWSRIRTGWEAARVGWRQLMDVVADPPKLRPLFTVAYGICVAIGVVTFVAPPRTIEGVTGDLLSTIWAWCFLVGGIIGLSTVWTPHWWLERLGLLVIGVGGIGIYGVVVAYLVFVESGNRGTQLGVIGLGLVAVLARAFLIHGYTYQPLSRRR